MVFDRLVSTPVCNFSGIIVCGDLRVLSLHSFVAASRMESSEQVFLSYATNCFAMFAVYILLCNDDSFYVGSTADVTARVKEHNEGILGAAHTFLRRPVTLVYTESFDTQLEAVRRERQLKGWSHMKKEALIKGDMAQLKALSKRRKS